MSKKTLEYISNNIITSESLVEKLHKKIDDSEKQKYTVSSLNLNPLGQQLALTRYFSEYYTFNDNVKFYRQGINRPITPEKLTFIYTGHDNYKFLSDQGEGLILVRTSINRRNEATQKDLLSSINMMLTEGYSKLDKTSLIDLLRPFSETDIDSYISGLIPNPKYIIKGQPPMSILEDVSIQKAFNFFNKFANVISKILNLNILFILPSVVSSSNSNQSLILSDLLEERKTLVMVLFIPNIHQYMMYKKSKLPFQNMIFFDNVFELNYETDTISSLINEKITKNIILENGLVLNNKIFREPIVDNKIEFEPLDRNRELSVIQLKGPDNIDRNYLLGIFGNLYEDDDKYNDLVGRIYHLDTTSGKGEIFWCKQYYDKHKK